MHQLRCRPPVEMTSQMGLIGLAVMGQVSIGAESHDGRPLQPPLIGPCFCRTLLSMWQRRDSTSLYSTGLLRRRICVSPGQRRKVCAQPIDTNACGLCGGPHCPCCMAGACHALISTGPASCHLLLAPSDAGLSEHLHGFKDLKEFVQSLQKPRWVIHVGKAA